MTDPELERIAADPSSLTDLARGILQAELRRRGLQPLEINSKPIPHPVVEFRDLVPVRKFRDLPEALLAKGSLDSAGIECHLADDNMVRMDWFISNLLGGGALPSARRILRSGNVDVEK